MKLKNNKQFLKWIEALRSGKYSQGRAALQSEYGFCCLGVACKVTIPSNKQRCNVYGHLFGGYPYRYQQPNAPRWLQRINSDFNETTKGKLLSAMNDSGFTFDEIADCLEAVYVHEVLS